MGYDLYAYIGPAIRVNKQKRQTPVTVNTCSNTDCKKYNREQSTNFCSDCGNPILPREKLESREVSLNDFVYDSSGDYEHWEDYLSCHVEFDDENVWIPNRGPDTMSYLHGEAIDLTIYMHGRDGQNSQEEQILVFENFFSEMFKDMRDFGLEFETVYVFKLYHS